nr:hypothetical protein [uncultured Anaerotignum sp.]
MKKLIPWLLLVLLTLSFGFGKGTTSIYGKVIARETDETGRLVSVVADTDSQGIIRLLLTERTRFETPVDFSAEDFLTDDTLSPSFVAFYNKRTGKNTSYGSETIRCYQANSMNLNLLENRSPTGTMTLADGTPVQVFTDETYTFYCLEDKETFLQETHGGTPGAVTVTGLEEFDDLTPEAKASIVSYFEQQGILYDIQTVAETAYTLYQKGEKDLFLVEQKIHPSSANKELLFISTIVRYPSEEAPSGEYYLTEAFDRSTGAHIPKEELFTCPPEELCTRLLELSDVPEEDRAIVEEAFQPEYIIFSHDNVFIQFPPEVLPKYPEGYGLSLDRKRLKKELLQDWAIPKDIG